MVGDPQTMYAVSNSGRATRSASSTSPNRTATSTPCSIRLRGRVTSVMEVLMPGYFSAKTGRWGQMTRWPAETGESMCSVPFSPLT
jgi:hypothetical protein